MARFGTPESASPDRLPGGSCGCTAHRAGNAADGTQRERAYSSDPDRRRRSVDAAGREAAGNADQSRRAPAHLGRRGDPRTLADQIPEHFPVNVSQAMEKRPG
ncbi:hypothetical protein GCM10010420_12080 [Streptomyces glaucosporus]|uniref:Uncharacterized protein n=1 Tax=Streptomyces glaucosporus TaxID=284044 RepID=A0ABN3HYH6_9ACTN